MLLKSAAPINCIRHLPWLLLLGLLSACDYPPVLKTEPTQPPQPFLAKFIGHAPTRSIAPISPSVSASPVQPRVTPPPEPTTALQALPSMELEPIKIQISDTHSDKALMASKDVDTEMLLETQQHDENNHPNTTLLPPLPPSLPEVTAVERQPLLEAAPETPSENTSQAPLAFTADNNPKDLPTAALKPEPSTTAPQPGHIDLENALDLHQVRIQLMAESP